jgi:hypothetical protein
MQKEERIPHKFDEPLELSGVDINSLFQESDVLPLSTHQKYKYTKDVLSQKKKHHYLIGKRTKKFIPNRGKKQ